jgi:hypothetical protein
VAANRKVSVNGISTRTSASLTGVLSTFFERSAEGWLSRRGVNATPPITLMIYLIMVITPFAVFVIGINADRWKHNYWFSEDGRRDCRQIVIRWAFYTVGWVTSAYLL